MRNFVFAAIATLAVTFGSLAAASATPILGDGSNMTVPSTPTYNVAGG